MKKILVVLCAMAAVGFAQECPLGKDAAAKAKAKPVSVVAKIEKLEAGAEKGCKTSDALLAKLRETVKVDTNAALKEKVAACEQYAGKGCGASKQVLQTINAEMGKKPARPMRVSERLAYYSKCADAGCESSAAVMQPLLAEHGVKTSADMIAVVKAWEIKADQGCGSCVEKLAAVSAKLPNRKKAMSKRVAYLAKCADGGCAKSATSLQAVMNEAGAKDRADLMTKVAAWEKKAESGCKKCVTKLANLDAKLMASAAAPAAPAKAEGGSAGKDCSNCTDCTNCTDCGDCDK